MSVEEGVTFFASESRRWGKKIEVLNDLGLGYLTLGQSATTLSGGEAAADQDRDGAEQASAVERTRSTFSTSRRPGCIWPMSNGCGVVEPVGRRRPHGAADRASHDVIKTADYVIDLGPEGGHAGGEVVVDGDAGGHRGV